MPLPVYKGAGGFGAGTSTVSTAQGLTMPSGGAAPVAGDVLLLGCESENQVITLATPAGFVEVPNSPQGTGTAGTAGSTRMTLYAKRAAGGDVSPIIADPGDHVTGQIICVSGCKIAPVVVNRLYFSSTAPISQETTSAGWEYITESIALRLLTAPDGSALTLSQQVGPWTAGQDARALKGVSDPMLAGVVFTSGVTTVKCQFAAREFVDTENSSSRLQVRVVSNDGATVRATLLDVANYGPTTELINNATLRNKTFADGDAVAASYTTVAGDRLEISIGFSDSAGTSPEGQVRYGAPNGVADHGENETETTSLRPWIEFSSSLTFYGNPWNVTAGGVDAVSDVSGAIPGATTTAPNCLVLAFCSTSVDLTQTTNFSGWANADLANVTERTDNSNTVGLGGGFGMATGEKAAAGTYGATAVTLAAASLKGMISIALEGEGAGSPRPTVVRQAVMRSAVR